MSGRASAGIVSGGAGRAGPTRRHTRPGPGPGHGVMDGFLLTTVRISGVGGGLIG